MGRRKARGSNRRAAKSKNSVQIPELLDVLIVGGGPGGIAAACRAKELGLNALLLELDSLMSRIRDYPRDAVVKSDFDGDDKSGFQDGGELIAALQLTAIGKDEVGRLWKQHCANNSIPVHEGIEVTALSLSDDKTWEAIAWNHNLKHDCAYRAKHIVLAMGRGKPYHLDIPLTAEEIDFPMKNSRDYVGSPACVIGNGASAVEAIIDISAAKAEAEDQTDVYWSFQGERLPRVCKSLADKLYDAYIINRNIKHLPNSEPVAVFSAKDKREYLSIRTVRRLMENSPNEALHLEFPKEHCIACLSEDMPEAFLKSIGIEMTASDETENKHVLVSTLFETQQSNVFLIGDTLSEVYLETNDFSAAPKTVKEVKRYANIKSALKEAVCVVDEIKRRLAGTKKTEARAADMEKNEMNGVAEEQPHSEIDKDSAAKIQPEKVTTSDKVIDKIKAKLAHVLPGNLEQSHYSLYSNSTITIGKGECDITIPDDAFLSAHHASVVFVNEGFQLRDDGSKTGVFLRAREAQHMQVEIGDVLRLGKQFIRFKEIDGALGFVHHNEAGEEVGKYKIEEQPLILGRQAPDITLCADDKALSRRHMVVQAKDGHILIKDLNSINHSYLKVRGEIELQHGDQFRVGRQVFVFEEIKAESASDSEPSISDVEQEQPLQQAPLNES